MEQRKKRMLLALAMGAAVLFCGCAADDGDDTPPANSVDIPKYSGGKILRNKVVSLNESGDTWYEYLKFTGENGGDYALYKNGVKVDSYTNRKGETVPVPSSFSYDSAAGKFSAGGVSSYMFEAKRDGHAVSVIAAEEMTCTAEKPSLCAEWRASDITFTFDAEGNVNIVQAGGTARTMLYTNDSGWITAGGIPLFYSSQDRLFYPAYTTERTEVEAVGRNAADVETGFVSPVFILADIQLQLRFFGGR